MIDSYSKPTSFRFVLMGLLSVLAVGLAYAVFSLSSITAGLSELATQNIKTSGVSHEVTAVLLNYRAYDTLLELGVVLLALVAVWSLGSDIKRGVTKPRDPSQNEVLNTLAHLLVPLLILVAGYLLWVGAHAPGGAFQAGAVLAAAGVLLLLTGWHLGAWFIGFPLRFILVAGLLVFLLVGIGAMFFGRSFLEYPTAYAGALILLIEAVATLSIGITLAALFLGEKPEDTSVIETNSASSSEPN